MPNYQQGKIYKLISPYTDKIYIGSTVRQYLSQRLTSHVSHHNSFINGSTNKRVSSSDLLELGDVDIILLESYPCNSKDELEARERYWIDQNRELIVNKKTPHRGCQERNQEYYKNNKTKIKQQVEEWTENNKNSIAIRRNQKFDCECGGIYFYANKHQHLKTEKHQTYLMIQTL